MSGEYDFTNILEKPIVIITFVFLVVFYIVYSYLVNNSKSNDDYYDVFEKGPSNIQSFSDTNSISSGIFAKTVIVLFIIFVIFIGYRILFNKTITTSIYDYFTNTPKIDIHVNTKDNSTPLDISLFDVFKLQPIFTNDLGSNTTNGDEVDHDKVRNNNNLRHDEVRHDDDSGHDEIIHDGVIGRDVPMRDTDDQNSRTTGLLGGVDQVFNISGNNHTYDNARALCKAYDSRLATYDEIEDAYKKGGEWCNYGWSEGQNIFFPTQERTFNILQGIKGHEHDCGRPGINGGYIDNPNLKFGANCYGKKPLITPIEREIMDTSPLYPLNKKDIWFNKQVDYFKKQLNNILISPFNKQSWSASFI